MYCISEIDEFLRDEADYCTESQMETIANEPSTRVQDAWSGIGDQFADTNYRALIAGADLGIDSIVEAHS